MTVRLGRSTPAAPAARSRVASTSRTRLRPPVAPSPHIRRERLVAVLDGALERRLTIVVAGAGFGKSTVLSDWAGEVNCAWYTTSSDDASLAGFARGLADALRLRVPALPVDAAGPVTATAGPGAEQDETARAVASPRHSARPTGPRCAAAGAFRGLPPWAGIRAA